MRKMKKILNFILIILFISSTTITVFGENIYYSLNSNIVQQAKTQWCWAACAEIAAKSIYTQTNRNQWEGVAYVICKVG